MSKAKWRPGLMIWLVIGGLLLINVSVFLGGNDQQAMRRFWHHFNPFQWPEWYAVNLWLVFIGLLAALILRNSRVQTTLHSFYSSRFWQFVKTRFKKSKPNQTVVRFILHRKFGKWLLRKWLTFWKNIRIECYPAYAWSLVFIAVFIVFFNCSLLMKTPRESLWFFLTNFRHFIYYGIYTPLYLGPLVEYNVSGKITWQLFITPVTGLLFILWMLRIASKSKNKRRVV